MAHQGYHQLTSPVDVVMTSLYFELEQSSQPEAIRLMLLVHRQKYPKHISPIATLFLQYQVKLQFQIIAKQGTPCLALQTHCA
jgi:hypothetical protein